MMDGTGETDLWTNEIMDRIARRLGTEQALSEEQRKAVWNSAWEIVNALLYRPGGMDTSFLRDVVPHGTKLG